MNKSFKERQRENILTKLISSYEKKIEKYDKDIEELNKKVKYNEDVLRGIKINQAYWLGVIGLNLILFSTIGYFTSNVIRGFSIWILSSIVTGTTLLLFKGVGKIVSKDINKLNNDIDKKEKENEENEKDLESLKKHITPAHLAYQDSTRELERIVDSNDENLNLEHSFSPLQITEKTREEALSHPERYVDCDVRIRTGQFYTDEEYENYVEESLKRLLPDEKQGPILVKRNKYKRK